MSHDETAPIADWFDDGIERTADQLNAATLIGTLAIAHYQAGKADFEPMAAALLLARFDPTDDIPVKRGIHLFDPQTQAVNYIEQQAGSGNPAVWLEELDPGTFDSPWTSNIFGDVKTLAIDAITAQALHGQRVDAMELEAWNTVLFSSIPIDAQTAQLAVRVAQQRRQYAERGWDFHRQENITAQNQLTSAIQQAIKRAQRAQKQHGVI
jgi:hypothetical protein